MTPAPDPLDELRPQDPAAESLAADADSLDAEAAKHQDRSIIGRWVVAVFLVVVVLLLAYVLVGSVVLGWDSIKTPVEYASTTISSVLVPIVTLVLGYYFGTGDRP